MDEVKLGRDARQLLQGIRGKTLYCILAMDHRKHSGPQYEYITSGSIGFTTREGDDLFVWFESVDVDPTRNLDEFVLRVGPSIEVRRWPGGPLLAFSDVSHDLAGFAAARVEDVCLLSYLGATRMILSASGWTVDWFSPLRGAGLFACTTPGGIFL